MIRVVAVKLIKQKQNEYDKYLRDTQLTDKTREN